MAKQITITDSETGKKYTLEYTRKTVEQMERAGFIAEDVLKKPVSMLPELFAGAFRAHHKWVKPDEIERMFDQIGNKAGLVGMLAEMYSEPLEALMGADEEEDGENEGNMSWEANW